MKNLSPQRFFSEEFGEKIGMTLHTNWVLYKTPDEIYYDLKTHGVRNLKSIYDRIVTDNPELGHIAVFETREYDVVMGAISKFNFEDIRFYVENKSTIVYYNQSQYDLRMELTVIAGCYPEWVLSPETTKKVVNFLSTNK